MTEIESPRDPERSRPAAEPQDPRLRDSRADVIEYGFYILEPDSPEDFGGKSLPKLPDLFAPVDQAQPAQLEPAPAEADPPVLQEPAEDWHDCNEYGLYQGDFSEPLSLTSDPDEWPLQSPRRPNEQPEPRLTDLNTSATLEYGFYEEPLLPGEQSADPRRDDDSLTDAVLEYGFYDIE